MSDNTSNNSGAGLREKLALALSKATEFANAGNVEEATKARDEAKNYSNALDILKSLEGFVPAAPAPAQAAEVMRPPLPGATQSQKDAGFITPSAAPTIGVASGEDAPVTLARLTYAHTFGIKSSEDKLVDMALRETNGADYQQKYFEQEVAFKSFLRHGVRPAKKEVVFTPKTIKMAFDQGIEDIATLKATMVEAADTVGAVLVPVDFQAELISRINGLTVVRGRATQQNTSRDRIEIPRQTGGNDQYRGNVRVKWVDELPTAGVSATNMTFAMESLYVNNVMATVGLSKNVLEDSALNIESLVMQELAYSIAIDEDNQLLVGTGVGKPQGILPNGVNPTLADGVTLKYTEVKSGSNTGVTWQGLINTTFGLAAQYRKNAVWIAARNTYGAITNLQNSSGNYLWQPYQFTGGSVGGAMPSMQLLGYPVLEQEIMPQIATNSYPLLFCDLSGYRIVDRVGMSMERYEDSVTAEANIVKLVLRRRMGGQVVEPWRFIAHKIST